MNHNFECDNPLQWKAATHKVMSKTWVTNCIG